MKVPAESIDGGDTAMDSNTTMTGTGEEPSPEAGPLLLSVPEAARLLGVGRTLCWEMVYSKQLPSVRLGRRVLIPRAVVEQLAGHREAS